MHYLYDPSNPNTLHYANIACSIEQKVRFQSTREDFYEQLNRIPLRELSSADVRAFEACLRTLDSDAIEKYVERKSVKIW